MCVTELESSDFALRHLQSSKNQIVRVGRMNQSQCDWFSSTASAFNPDSLVFT